MPRISEERREARRTEIVDAALRCFARNGFHQTSMPELLAEAGVSAGAFYRYFASKDEVILEIAAEAFGTLVGAVDGLLAEDPAPDVPGLLTAMSRPLRGTTFGDRGVDLDDMLRCAIQAWGETVRNEVLRDRAQRGFDAVIERLTEALTRGQEAGRVPDGVVPGDAARLIMAILPGLLMQRVVMQEKDAAAVLRTAGILMNPP
jgi:AcrR family transcriptional regulator